MVDAERCLEAVLSLGSFGCHETSVVDQQVQPRLLPVDLLGEGPHGRQRGEVELPDLDRA